MKESGYQIRIINKIKADGGIAINGNYTTAGEADLQCGIPVDIICSSCDATKEATARGNMFFPKKTILIYCGVEVKDEFNYHRVMGAVDENYNVIDKKKLKQHEVLQMAKIRETRKRGGLALVAYNYEQVKEYVNGGK